MGKKVKTKFPMARIKKIMQMDDDIGKVASVVPVLVSKSLELFLQSLIDKTCKEAYIANNMLKPDAEYDDTHLPSIEALDAAFSGNKRIVATTTHLKRCIEGNQEFDFLKAKVKDIKEVDVVGDSPMGSPRIGVKRKTRASNKNNTAGSGSNDSLVTPTLLSTGVPSSPIPGTAKTPRLEHASVFQLPPLQAQTQKEANPVPAPQLLFVLPELPTAKTSIQALVNPTNMDDDDERKDATFLA